MGEDTLEQQLSPTAEKKLKCYWRALKYGSISGVSGAFAWCMYDGYFRMHESLCDCTKYASLVSLGGSHVWATIGVLAGISAVSAGYLGKHVYHGVRHHCASKPSGGLEGRL